MADKLDLELCAQIAKGIIDYTKLPLTHTIGHEALSSTIFLHLGKRCLCSLKFKEQNLIFNIKDQSHTYDYANPDSFDPEKISKIIADFAKELEGVDHGRSDK